VWYGKEKITEKSDEVDEAEVADEVRQAKHAREKSYRGKISAGKSYKKFKRKGIRSYNKKKESRHKEGKAVFKSAQKGCEED
jgi:hypothetical protein